MSEGSPGRALALAGGDGAALLGLLAEVLEGLPRMDAGRAHAVADTLSRDDAAFGTFMDLLRTTVAAAVRDAARGRADAGQARLIAARPLDAWVDVWHGLCRLQDETEALYLDKRQAIVTGLGLLAGTVPRVS